MVSFFGEYRASLDGKNRVMVPSRLREQSGQAPIWVLTRGLDRCLALYTPSRWEELVSKISAAPFTKAKVRQFQRLMFSRAVHLECDKNGRILVPEYLKTGVLTGSKVVFAGLADRVELWDAQAWDGLQSSLEGDFENLAEDLFS